MDCRHLDDFYELYVLGAADPDIAVEISRHLDNGCACCTSRLREAALNVYLVSTLVPSSRPGPKTRARLLSRLKKK
ncbi:MAG: hypothetical protein DMG21_15930 [Acidobacteria bacterium]|nr:MAG: hypothetical protein DMG21_15930 [Acidobacteriota bacterium]